MRRIWRSEPVRTCMLAVGMLGAIWMFLIAMSALMPLWMALPLWAIGIIAGLVIAGALWVLR
jgi:hypothetical protein